VNLIPIRRVNPTIAHGFIFFRLPGMSVILEAIHVTWER
jgi:hypothetical protein